MTPQRRRMLCMAGLFEFTYTGAYSDGRVNGKGVIEFTSSGTLNVIQGGDASLYLLGGGGGGGHGGDSASVSKGGPGGGGGGSGYFETVEKYILPGLYSLVMGAGGAAGVWNDRVGKTGGVTSGLGRSVNGGFGGTGGQDSIYAGAYGIGGAGGNPGSNGGNQKVANHVDVGGAGGSPNGGKGGDGGDLNFDDGAMGKDGGAGKITLTFT